MSSNDQTKSNQIPIVLITEANCDPALADLPPAARGLAIASRFTGKAGQSLLVVGQAGDLEQVLFGVGKGDDFFVVADLAQRLPGGEYRFDDLLDWDRNLTMLALLMGTYRFDRYKTAPQKTEPVTFQFQDGGDYTESAHIAASVARTRSLVNTPSSDMGPAELAAAAQDIAKPFDAQIREVIGDDLLKEGFEMIHAVGRASSRTPRLIDMTWGNESHPKVTLVGKGVCFDSGGLDIKPSSSMLLMKKDMGGAANVLGLAQMIMSNQLQVRLRVLIPAVENSISGNAFRPGDVLKSYKGLTVEIENTDAEGRLVLADALALADEEAPDLLIDMATLTGAARVAMGPEVVPFYSEDADFVSQVSQAGKTVQDPVWQLPLWQPYAEGLSSKVADVMHTSPGGFAGSITAALFLQKFVEKAKTWAHFDIYAWNPKDRPGRPMGGEAMAIRALYQVIKARYAK
ncbi:MAG: leucyl aminopeptidase family protein [Alphaproteobacteria bacterium]|nr:MAG: leucyl aminopeptidase family protein [Alphaproteobacteria bacterium]